MTDIELFLVEYINIIVYIVSGIGIIFIIVLLIIDKINDKKFEKKIIELIKKYEK